jgi:hypothetical protein
MSPEGPRGRNRNRQPLSSAEHEELKKRIAQIGAIQEQKKVTYSSEDREGLDEVIQIKNDGVEPLIARATHEQLWGTPPQPSGEDEEEAPVSQEDKEVSLSATEAQTYTKQQILDQKVPLAIKRALREIKEERKAVLGLSRFWKANPFKKEEQRLKDLEHRVEKMLEGKVPEISFIEYDKYRTMHDDKPWYIAALVGAARFVFGSRGKQVDKSLPKSEHFTRKRITKAELDEILGHVKRAARFDNPHNPTYEIRPGAEDFYGPDDIDTKVLGAEDRPMQPDRWVDFETSHVFVDGKDIGPVPPLPEKNQELAEFPEIEEETESPALARAREVFGDEVDELSDEELELIEKLASLDVLDVREAKQNADVLFNDYIERGETTLEQLELAIAEYVRASGKGKFTARKIYELVDQRVKDAGIGRMRNKPRYGGDVATDWPELEPLTNTRSRESVSARAQRRPFRFPWRLGVGLVAVIGGLVGGAMYGNRIAREAENLGSRISGTLSPEPAAADNGLSAPSDVELESPVLGGEPAPRVAFDDVAMQPGTYNIEEEPAVEPVPFPGDPLLPLTEAQLRTLTPEQLAQRNLAIEEARRRSRGGS